MAQTLHILPTAPLAERVLLPGDPGRALRLAQELLDEPRMLNHHRGLWGYTGTAADGQPLSIQSTGMGGPSLAIVVHELVALGARRLLRIGTCGAFATGLQLGGLLIATAALAADGTSRALGAGAEEAVPASAGLLAALERAAGEPERNRAAAAEPEHNRAAAAEPEHNRAAAAEPERTERGLIATTDLFYDERAPEREWAARGALAVEMESAALFTLAARLGVQAATLLIVSDTLHGARERLDEAALHEAERRMGHVAVAALA